MFSDIIEKLNPLKVCPFGKSVASNIKIALSTPKMIFLLKFQDMLIIINISC